MISRPASTETQVLDNPLLNPPHDARDPSARPERDGTQPGDDKPPAAELARVVRRFRPTLLTFTALAVVFCIGLLTAWPMMKSAFFKTLYDVALEHTKEQSLRIADLIQQELDRGVPKEEVLGHFQTMLANSPQSRSQFVCIIEGADRVIAHPIPSHVNKDIRGWTTTTSGRVVPYSYAAQHGVSHGGTQTRLDGSQDVIFQAGLRGVPWSVCVHVSYEKLRADTNRLLRSAAQVSLPWVVCILICATGLVRWIGGRFERELAAANGALEQRVRERTEQLEEANERLSERVRRERQKVARNVNFLNNVSHELRTPLNAIKGFTDFLHMEPHGPLGDKRYQIYIRDIRTSSEHLVDVLNNVLDLSQLQETGNELDTSWHEVDTLVNEVVSITQTIADNRHIRLVQSGKPVMVKVDGIAMRRVLLNLVSNAVKFSRENGEVRITWRVDDAEAGGQRFKISVEDDGAGIAAEDLERVKKPFEQSAAHVRRNQQGTGLGLPIADTLVTLHGGTLAIESDLGHGTTVTVTLPGSRLDTSCPSGSRPETHPGPDAGHR